MTELIRRLKSLMGFGERETDESLDEEIRHEPDIIDVHANRLMEKGVDFDVAYIHLEKGQWDFGKFIESFEGEVGSQGRITIPVEIRDEYDLDHEDEVLASVWLIGEDNKSDIVDHTRFKCTIGVDGRMQIPKSNRERMEWYRDAFVRVHLHTVVATGEEEDLPETEQKDAIVSPVEISMAKMYY